MRAHDVTDETFDEQVLRSPVPVLVDFWAPWCRPCRAIEPILGELVAAAGERLRLVRLDVDTNLATPGRYAVLSIPTVILFDSGRPRATIVGAASRKTFERELAGWL